jgi:tRNA dimethylallyltransferase
MTKPGIVVICGPTGIGKTELSLQLAELFGGAVVSADSMQIYRFMDIGTAKPTPAERQRVPHFMIDVADPDASYDAARYAEEARGCIAELHRAGRLPLVVGGTGFYVKALLHGLFAARPASSEIRARLREEARQSGSRRLYERLLACDPEAAGRIHPNDAYRIIRALEVWELTGRPMSEWQKAHGFAEAPFASLKICLHIDRETLYERIERRVEKMIRRGLLEEVRSLLERGYPPDIKPMQALGYRHMIQYLQGLLPWDEAVRLMKRDTRRYAKRQLVWFRKDPEFVWMDPDDAAAIRRRIADFLGSFR